MGITCIVVFVGRNGQGWVSRLGSLGLAGVNDFRRLREGGTVPSPGVIGPDSGSTGETLMKQAVGRYGLRCGWFIIFE